MKNNKLVTRWLIYVAGMSVQGLGLYLNARCGLGTSALLGVAYVLGLYWNVSFGDATKIIFALYIAAPRRMFFSYGVRFPRLFDLWNEVLPV